MIGMFSRQGISKSHLGHCDPGLAKLAKEIFGDTDWRYQRPSQRKAPGHLHGFNPLDTPTFRWPKKLQRKSSQPIRNQKKK